MPDFPDIETDSDAMTESDTRLEKPPLYKAILHNDDFTTMEFVVFILSHVFLRSDAEAFAIMFQVHHEGIGIAGVYSFEIANMKAEKAMNLARAHEYPLLAQLRKNNFERIL